MNKAEFPTETLADSQCNMLLSGMHSDDEAVDVDRTLITGEAIQKMVFDGSFVKQTDRKREVLH